MVELRSRVVVVVPNWNGAPRLPACIGALAEQEHGDLEIVVVDNGSTDDSVSVLDELGKEIAPIRLTVLRNETNRGFAGGVNRGIQHALDAGVGFIALLNNDAVVEPRWLTSLTKAMDDHPDASVVTGRLLMADGRTADSTGDFYSDWGLAFPRDRDQPADPPRSSGFVFGATGGASLYRSDLFTSVGLFDEDFFAYFEDVDLSFRVQLAGHRIYYCEHAVARHDQGATSRSLPGFVTSQFFRNLPLVLVKNVPAGLLLPIGARFALVYTLMIAHSVRRGEGGPALRGARQAIALLARRGFMKRREVQRSRVISTAQLRSRLWAGLPPGVRVLRGTRDQLRSLLGIGPVRDQAA